MITSRVQSVFKISGWLMVYFSVWPSLTIFGTVWWKCKIDIQLSNTLWLYQHVVPEMHICEVAAIWIGNFWFGSPCSFSSLRNYGFGVLYLDYTHDTILSTYEMSNDSLAELNHLKSTFNRNKTQLHLVLSYLRFSIVMLNAYCVL